MCGDRYIPIQVDMFQDRIMDVVLIIKHISKSAQDYLVPRRCLRSNSGKGMFHRMADVKLKKKKCRMFNLWIYNCFGIILYNILFTYLQIFFILVLKELVCMCVWVICYLTKSNLKRIYKNNLNGLLWWRNFRWFYSFMLLCITIFFYTVCIHYVVKV